MKVIRKIGILVAVVVILTFDVNAQQFTVLKKECTEKYGFTLGKYQLCQVTFNNNTKGEFYIVDNVYKLIKKRTIYDETYYDYSKEEYVIWALYRKLNGYLDFKEGYLVQLKEDEIENNRIQHIKNAQIGDKICYEQDFICDKKADKWMGIISYDNAVHAEYKMNIVAYVENVVDDRILIRVIKVSSSNNEYYNTPTINEIDLKKDEKVWIKPNDYVYNKTWNICN